MEVIARETVPVRKGLLRYTGSLDEAAFRATCAAYTNWYHSFYFDNGFEVVGEYDMGADIEGYHFPPLAGKRVLDIGTGGGWFAHYFAQQGAIVTTVDARDYRDFDRFGAYGSPELETFFGNDRRPDRFDRHGNAVYHSPVSKAFWVIDDVLDSGIEFVNGRVYDVSPKLFGGKRFDMVFMGAILLHLRDPIGALMAARSVCDDLLIATTPVVLGQDDAEFASALLPYYSYDPVTWWLPNALCYEQWFRAAGFVTADVSRTVLLRGDRPRFDEHGRQVNGDQILRLAHARVGTLHERLNANDASMTRLNPAEQIGRRSERTRGVSKFVPPGAGDTIRAARSIGKHEARGSHHAWYEFFPQADGSIDFAIGHSVECDDELEASDRLRQALRYTMIEGGALRMRLRRVLDVLESGPATASDAQFAIGKLEGRFLTYVSSGTLAPRCIPEPFDVRDDAPGFERIVAIEPGSLVVFAAGSAASGPESPALARMLPEALAAGASLESFLDVARDADADDDLALVVFCAP